MYNSETNPLLSCKTCCCVSHCQLKFHNKKDEPVDALDEILAPVYDSFLLDRSWDAFDDYETELLDAIPVDNTRDLFMSYICAVNLDFKDDFAI